MSKLGMLTAGAVGYVVGARAGRERYEQIVFQAQRLWTNPRVQQGVSDAQDLAREKGPAVADKVVQTAKHAGSAVASQVSGDEESPGQQQSPGQRAS